MRHDIVDYCARIGQEPLLVQGAGGNVSWKDGGTMWIKASGAWLADAAKDDIFVPVDLDALRATLAGPPHPRLPERAEGHARRPSIETFMHVVMPQRIVIHLHAIEALAVLVRADALETLRTRLRDRFHWEWVEYRQPGAVLARSVAVVLGRTPDASIVFLQNHGILVGGDTIDEIDRRIKGLVSALKQDVASSESASQPIHKSPNALHIGSLEYAAIEDARIQSLVHTPGLYRRLSEVWVLYPDHVVFLGEKAPVFETRREARRYGRRRQPPLLFIRGEGVFAKPDFDQAQRAQLVCYYEVLTRQKPQDVLMELTKKEIHDLLHWEAEQYRVNAGSAKDPSTSKGGNGMNRALGTTGSREPGDGA